ncbi:hypothetical protein ACH5RR_037299 [Cinchona calisaya]|uniref:Uncharacterized protein n=1 Tax=Cinchona calisaya TaxID=153742 RepID=A0ABD2Y772_9GENT
MNFFILNGLYYFGLRLIGGLYCPVGSCFCSRPDHCLLRPMTFTLSWLVFLVGPLLLLSMLICFDLSQIILLKLKNIVGPIYLGHQIFLGPIIIASSELPFRP